MCLGSRPRRLAALSRMAYPLRPQALEVAHDEEVSRREEEHVEDHRGDEAAVKSEPTAAKQKTMQRE